MREYAIIDDNKVIDIISLDDEGYLDRARGHQCVIDIEDIIPKPQVGWILEGNIIKPVSIELNPDQLDLIQQTSQRQFGLKLLPIATDLVGARNLKLARDGVPVNVASLAGQMASVKLLLEGGALKTVRGLVGALKITFPSHADIMDLIISEITNFLINNGWN